MGRYIMGGGGIPGGGPIGLMGMPCMDRYIKTQHKWLETGQKMSGIASLNSQTQGQLMRQSL